MGQHSQGYRLPLQPGAARLPPHLKTHSQTHLEEGGNSRATRASFPKPNISSGHFSKGWKFDCC